MERVNYLMNAYDVAMELGVSKGHAYKVIRKLNVRMQVTLMKKNLQNGNGNMDRRKN